MLLSDMRWGNECEFYALTSPKDMAILIIMQVPQSNEEVFFYMRGGSCSQRCSRCIINLLFMSFIFILFIISRIFDLDRLFQICTRIHIMYSQYGIIYIYMYLCI